MEKVCKQSNYQNGNVAFGNGHGWTGLRIADTGEYQKAPNRMAIVMKIYLVMVTIAVFSFSAVSGAVISVLPQMQFIQYQSVVLVNMDIKSLSEINI